MDFALQCVAITTSAAIFGFQIDISLLTIPSLLLAPPQLMVRQWKTMFDLGKRTALTATPLSAISYACLAYRLQHKTFALAAVATVGAIPYTLIFLEGVNKKLEKMAKKASEDAKAGGGLSAEIGVGGGESAVELVKMWQARNFGRALFALTGTALGLWAALS